MLTSMWVGVGMAPALRPRLLALGAIDLNARQGSSGQHPNADLPRSRPSAVGDLTATLASVASRFTARFHDDNVSVYLDATLSSASVRREGPASLPTVSAVVTADGVVLTVDNYEVHAPEGWPSAIETLAAPLLVEADATSFVLTGPGGTVRCQHIGGDPVTDGRTSVWLATLERA